MMKKTTLLLATIALFTFTSGVALAASAKCTVTEIKDNVVTLDCGKTAEKMKVGDKVKVKVKTAKKKVIEGC